MNRFMAVDILSALRTWGRLRAAELRDRLGASPATLMRAARVAGDEVIVRGRARRSTYAARRALRGSMAPIPVYRIDERGAAHEQGLLNLTYPDGCVFDLQEPMEWPTEGDEMADGWYDGLPYPMLDMRPQGFLGRNFARNHAGILQVDEDPNRWSDDDVLHALTLLGDDTPGNLIIGEASYRQWLGAVRNPVVPIDDAQLAARYAELADTALRHGVIGSSAGGEFPKFTTARRLGPAGEVAHVIVKFSGNDNSEGTRRWSDLLVCEHLAGRVLARLPGSNSAADSTIHQATGRTYLEVVRFDRHGAHGRSGLVSLQALNGAFVGTNAAPWPATIIRLDSQRLLAEQSVAQVQLLWHFGKLIANTDMHEGNLSFQPALPGQAGLRAAPAYDMLPMLYAPARGVEMAARDFAPPLPLPSEAKVWMHAAVAALDFWRLAGADARISDEFRGTCSENARKVEAAMRHPAVAST